MDKMTKMPYYERPLLTDLPAATAVSSLLDLPYTADNDSPRLDLYLPMQPPGGDGYPLIIFLHGGPISPGGEQPWPKEWRVFQEYGRVAAGLGLAAAVVNHRYLGYESLPLAISDVLQAVQHLEAASETHNLDLDRIALWAFSGAGMLLRPFLEEGAAPGLRALVAFYPICDLTHLEDARAVFNQDELIALSPLGVIETMRPHLSLFIARAGRDRPGLNRSIDSFVQQSLYYNRPLELHNIPGAEHGFDMFNDIPGTRATVAHAFRFITTRLLMKDKTHDRHAQSI
jgi:acetyl esterase/lipase